MEDLLFRVYFFKDLPDSSGHVHKCCQGDVEAVGQDEASAVTVARRCFERRKGVSHWTLRADYEAVECLSEIAEM